MPELEGCQARFFRALLPPLITLGRFDEDTPQTVYQGAPVDHDDEDLTQVAFRTMDLTDAMPGKPFPCEQQATVAQSLRRDRAFEVVEVTGESNTR